LRRFWLNLALTVVLAGGAGFVGARYGAKSLVPPARSAQEPVLLRQSVHDIVQTLKLTPAQHKAVDAIEQRYVHNRNALRVKISQANIELAGALAEEMSYGPQANKAIDNLEGSVGELQRQTVQYVLEVRDVLTPEQQVAYDQKVVQALTSDLF
jgi:Spy/CpxP family protein refolding chaperone